MKKIIVHQPLGRKADIGAGGNLEGLPFGGPGSGNWAHAGRKGKRGGSQSVKGGRFQIGITSARPDKKTVQVEREMEDFKAAMKATPVKGMSVHLGVGGWEGGSEPTYVTQYTGNGEAKAALAAFGKKHDQDGVLIQRYVRKGTPGAQPQSRVVFDRSVDGKEIQAIEGAMVSKGFGGWTWGRYRWQGDADAHLHSSVGWGRWNAPSVIHRTDRLTEQGWI